MQTNEEDLVKANLKLKEDLRQENFKKEAIKVKNAKYTRTVPFMEAPFLNRQERRKLFKTQNSKKGKKEMKKGILLIALYVCAFLVGCSTVKPEKLEKFYYVENEGLWRVMRDQDQKIVSINPKDSDRWYLKEKIEDYPIIEDGKVYHQGVQVYP